jgi:drug/metabolite transporter (DMT)-like permease
MNIFMAVMFAGLVVFGIAALRNRAMPRGNGLPVLAGVWWLLLTIQAYVFPQIIQVDFMPAWFSLAIFSMMGLFLALLGYVLQADAPLAGTNAPLRG